MALYREGETHMKCTDAFLTDKDTTTVTILEAPFRHHGQGSLVMRIVNDDITWVWVEDIAVVRQRATTAITGQMEKEKKNKGLEILV